MRMKHILVEGYCDKDNPSNINPCNENNKELGIHCLSCKNFSYTICPNEIAYANEDGVVENLEDFVGFGLEMDVNDEKEHNQMISKWHSICKTKIAEAYNEYMEIRKKKL